MAAGLNKTKRRIVSVNSTKKITKAMELVATVKLKRYKDIMLDNECYTNEIVSLIHMLFSKLSKEENSLYLEEKDAPKDLVIVVNSNLGLCAGYNNDVYRFVDSNVPKDKSLIMPIGIKGDEYYRRNGYEIDENYVSLNEHINYEDIAKLARSIHYEFIKGKFKSIKLVYTKYVNSIKFVPELITIFPLAEEGEVNELEYPPIFDPDIKTLIKDLVPIYVNSLLYQKIIESQVSEQASRRTAMENATDNADDLIADLTLEYNKARQAAITQEINEVVAGQQK
ncbi:MAG: ATP synthase F1 subunit gamma [Bacilli bacterium]|nr:ATP synthase F1 subunit gamma [Bacilli bacterium]